MAAPASGRVRINVGGRLFETTRATLQLAGEGSVLGPLTDAMWNPQPPGGAVPEFFIDRDPEIFRALLNLLRTGHFDTPPGVSLETVIGEADYYGLLEFVKAALHPPTLDGNEMCRVGVLRPNVGAAELCTAIAALPDGSVDVAHGSRVTCYDWSLHRTRTIITDLPQVDALVRLSNSHLVAAGSRSGDSLAVYDTQDGARTHTVACRGSHPMVRALAASDRHLFVASLRKTIGLEWGVEKGVGVVDRGTLREVVSGGGGAAPITTRRLNGPDLLQWLPMRNLLLVAKKYSGGALLPQLHSSLSLHVAAPTARYCFAALPCTALRYMRASGATTIWGPCLRADSASVQGGVSSSTGRRTLPSRANGLKHRLHLAWVSGKGAAFAWGMCLPAESAWGAAAHPEDRQRSERATLSSSRKDEALPRLLATSVTAVVPPA